MMKYLNFLSLCSGVIFLASAGTALAAVFCADSSASLTAMGVMGISGVFTAVLAR